MKYNKIRESLKTGDIVLFSGRGMISTVIKLITNSKWTHVGMVIRELSFDCVLLWESTTLSKLKDISSGIAKKGVMLVPLSHRIATYDGEVGIRQLAESLTDSQIFTLSEFRREVKDRLYEQSITELLKAAYDGPLGENVEDLSSIFCSELGAEAYQRIGLVNDFWPSNEYTPKDFSEDGKIDAHIEKNSLQPLIKIEI